MSPTPNVVHYSTSNMVKIFNGIMFDFYLGRPHFPSSCASSGGCEYYLLQVTTASKLVGKCISITIVQSYTGKERHPVSRLLLAVFVSVRACTC